MPGPPTRRRHCPLLVEYAESIVELAATLRPGRDGMGSQDLLLCLHGLGCARDSFDSALAAEPLADLTICTFDFPGHGGSTAPLPAHTLRAYADLTAGVVELLAPRRLFLVGHSMGGAVGLVASPELARRTELAGFVSVEGNLVGQDCGLVSRGAAELPLARFVRQEHPRFAAGLADADQPALRTWGGWYAQADPVALYQAATSLVEWSDSGVLLDLFTALPGAGYVYGADSGNLGYLLPRLSGMPVHRIPGSGHFPMLDQPRALWRAVAEQLAGALDRRPGRVLR